MNKADVVDILSLVQAGDRRTVGEGDVEMWFLVISDVPKDFATSAVVAHFRDCPGVWLEPGHIVQRWREFRQDRAMRESDAERAARQAALDARVAEAIEPAVAATAIPLKYTRPSQRQDGKPNPLSIRCPWCHAGEFRPCKTPNTDVTLRDPHPSRVEAVSK